MAILKEVLDTAKLRLEIRLTGTHAPAKEVEVKSRAWIILIDRNYVDFRSGGRDYRKSVIGLDFPGIINSSDQTRQAIMFLLRLEICGSFYSNQDGVITFNVWSWYIAPKHIYNTDNFPIMWFSYCTRPILNVLWKTCT